MPVPHLLCVYELTVQVHRAHLVHQHTYAQVTPADTITSQDESMYDSCTRKGRKALGAVHNPLVRVHAKPWLVIHNPQVGLGSTQLTVASLKYC